MPGDNASEVMTGDNKYFLSSLDHGIHSSFVARAAALAKGRSGIP